MNTNINMNIHINIDINNKNDVFTELSKIIRHLIVNSEVEEIKMVANSMFATLCNLSTGTGDDDDCDDQQNQQKNDIVLIKLDSI